MRTTRAQVWHANRAHRVLAFLLMLPLLASCIIDGEPVSEIDLPVPGELIVVRDTNDDDRGELFLINADGTDIRRIMDDEGYGMPSWSPDGRRIAAIADSSSGHPIVIIDMETNTVETVDVPPGNYSDIHWRPNGDGVVFAGFDHGRDPVHPDGSEVGFLNSQLYAANLDTLESWRLTEDDLTNYVGVGWSPERDRIAYSNDDGLWIANADGSDPVHVSGDLRIAQRAVWSPDGSSVAFVGYPDEFPGIYVVNADGSNRRRAVPDGFESSIPVWSPDGAALAISHYDRGRATTELYVLDVVSGDLRKLAEPDGGIYPAWSPDGEWIAYVTQYMRGESLGPTHLSVVNVEDPDPETIVRDVAFSWFPEWRPSPD